MRSVLSQQHDCRRAPRTILHLRIGAVMTDDIPVPVQPDPRFEAVLNLIRSGEFGWEGYFAQLIDSLNGSSDYYLLANDFPSYLEAQVRCVAPRKAAVHHRSLVNSFLGWDNFLAG